MPNPTGAGFFGKLPGTGDFVQRRLPASFVDVWDRRFEQAVSASRCLRSTTDPNWMQHRPLTGIASTGGSESAVGAGGHTPGLEGSQVE